MAENTSTATLTAEGSDEQELVTCIVDNVEFGLDIHAVQEIVRLPKITPVPKAPAYVKGVSNLRGNVLPIINSRVRFGMPANDSEDNNRVVVVELNGAPTGLIVDGVREVMHVKKRDVEPAPPVVHGVDSRFLEGVVKLDEGKRLVMLLAHNQLTDLQDFGAASAAQDASGIQAAQVHAASGEDAEDEYEHLVTFRVQDEEYGIPIMDVKEIIRVPKITAVPNSPTGVMGITSLRNQVLPVVDLRTQFNLSAAGEDTRHDDERCVVVSIGEASVALRVDAVNEVLNVPRAAVEPTPEIVTSEGDTHERLRGVAKLNDGKRLIMMLDVRKLVRESDLRALTGQSATAGTGGGGVGESTVATAAKDTDERQLVSFKVAGEEFAMDIMQVQEIIRLDKVTKVPHAASFVEGLVNLRGNVLPVIDLRRRFDMESKAYDDSTRVVVVDIQGRKTGIIVDAVSEVLRLSSAKVEHAPAIVKAGFREDFIEGVGKLAEGKRMLLLLRANRLLSDQEVSELGDLAGQPAAN
jgi:purine-binding chemotaxis protein CheW